MYDTATMNTSRIVELSSKIDLLTRRIDKELEDRSLRLSFDVDGANEVPDVAQDDRLELLAAISELQCLVDGPLPMIMRLAGWGNNIQPALHAIAKYELAKTFPVGTTSTYANMSAISGLNEADLKRVLRMAMTFGIFRETKHGIVEHTAASRVLAGNEMLGGWVELAMETVMASGFHLVDAMQKWPGSPEPTHSGFNVLTGQSNKSMFATLAQDHSRAAKFAKSMKLYTDSPSLSPYQLADHFDWSQFGTIVDVGGNRGHISIAIARKHPNIRCIVQDQINVIQQASLPPDVCNRIQLVAHDFFTPQTIAKEDVDAFLLRWVLHDWSDVYAVKIIQSLIPSLRNGSKVVVNEMCLPDIVSPPFYRQQVGRSMDLVMKSIQNGQERERSQWIQLFRMAAQEFELETIIEPPGAKLAIMVFVWNEDTSRKPGEQLN